MLKLKTMQQNNKTENNPIEKDLSLFSNNEILSLFLKIISLP